VVVSRTLYSVPYRLIGKRLDVRATAAMVEFYLDGELVKTKAVATGYWRFAWSQAVCWL
jgi:Mu transposase, C-terminal domain